MKDKVAIYCRVSTAMQSTDRQQVELLSLAKSLNYSISDDMIFVDVISGFKRGEVRPQFSKMLQYIDEGKISIILFSELTRLGRNSVELLKQIQELQQKGISMYFQKQNLWVKDKNDFGSQIVLSVLAVTASYEIELLTERTVSGKINKIQDLGTEADARTYGYRTNALKKIEINPEESPIVLRIFEMYANGKPTTEICEWLNSNKIPTATYTRFQTFKENRRKKGIEDKDYHKSSSWRMSTISRMLQNELYKGVRHIKYHKPDPQNPLPIKERKDRKVIFDYTGQFEQLRIISDELWVKVQNRLEKAPYNKNNAVKHDNLLKHLLVCGECGSNFSVSKGKSTSTLYTTNARSYKCYGTVNRKDHPRTCSKGAEISMWKLDGLVLQISIGLILSMEFEKTSSTRIKELEAQIIELKKHRCCKEDEVEENKKSYQKELHRLLKLSNADDDVVSQMMKEVQETYMNKSETLKKELEKITHKIAYCEQKINDLSNLTSLFDIIKSPSSMQDKFNQIRNNKTLVKIFVDEYIEKIELFRWSDLWVLVVIHYKSGEEFWGTIKCARYKKDEMYYHEEDCPCGVEFKSWILDNSNKVFTYNKNTHLICYTPNIDEFYDMYLSEHSMWNFKELTDRLDATNCFMTYPMYDYEYANSKIGEPSKKDDINCTDKMDTARTYYYIGIRRGLEQYFREQNGMDDIYYSDEYYSFLT